MFSFRKNELNLTDSRWQLKGQHITSQDLKNPSFLEALSKNDKLEELDLSYNQIESIPEEFLKVIANHPTLSTINLEKNGQEIPAQRIPAHKKRIPLMTRTVHTYDDGKGKESISYGAWEPDPDGKMEEIIVPEEVIPAYFAISLRNSEKQKVTNILTIKKELASIEKGDHSYHSWDDVRWISELSEHPALSYFDKELIEKPLAKIKASKLEDIAKGIAAVSNSFVKVFGRINKSTERYRRDEDQLTAKEYADLCAEIYKSVKNAIETINYSQVSIKQKKELITQVCAITIVEQAKIPHKWSSGRGRRRFEYKDEKTCREEFAIDFVGDVFAIYLNSLLITCLPEANKEKLNEATLNELKAYQKITDLPYPPSCTTDKEKLEKSLFNELREKFQYVSNVTSFLSLQKEIREATKGYDMGLLPGIEKMEYSWIISHLQTNKKLDDQKKKVLFQQVPERFKKSEHQREQSVLLLSAIIGSIQSYLEDDKHSKRAKNLLDSICNKPYEEICIELLNVLSSSDYKLRELIAKDIIIAFDLDPQKVRGQDLIEAALLIVKNKMLKGPVMSRTMHSSASINLFASDETIWQSITPPTEDELAALKARCYQIFSLIQTKDLSKTTRALNTKESRDTLLKRLEKAKDVETVKNVMVELKEKCLRTYATSVLSKISGGEVDLVKSSLEKVQNAIESLTSGKSMLDVVDEVEKAVNELSKRKSSSSVIIKNSTANALIGMEDRLSRLKTKIRTIQAEIDNFTKHSVYIQRRLIEENKFVIATEAKLNDTLRKLRDDVSKVELQKLQLANELPKLEVRMEKLENNEEFTNLRRLFDDSLEVNEKTISTSEIEVEYRFNNLIRKMREIEAEVGNFAYNPIYMRRKLDKDPFVTETDEQLNKMLREIKDEIGNAQLMEKAQRIKKLSKIEERITELEHNNEFRSLRTLVSEDIEVSESEILTAAILPNERIAQLVKQMDELTKKYPHIPDPFKGEGKNDLVQGLANRVYSLQNVPVTTKLIAEISSIEAELRQIENNPEYRELRAMAKPISVATNMGLFVPQKDETMMLGKKIDNLLNELLALGMSDNNAKRLIKFVEFMKKEVIQLGSKSAFERKNRIRELNDQFNRATNIYQAISDRLLSEKILSKAPHVPTTENEEKEVSALEQEAEYRKEQKNIEKNRTPICV